MTPTEIAPPMAGRVWLVRHASHAALDKVLVGRGPDPGLSARGRIEARELASACAAMHPVQLHASPRRRALETAASIAERSGLDIMAAQALDEVDFGRWTGERFDELLGDPQWQRWNSSRAAARCPGGECMRDVRRRALAHVLIAARAARTGPVIMVTHAEVIRALVLVARDMSLDDWAEIDIAPASVTEIAVTHGRLQLVQSMPADAAGAEA